MTRFAAAAVVLGLAASAATAQTDAVKSLTIGDKAPKVDISHFVTGEEVKDFKPGHVYVVEFWATWCGPCRASMPHLTETQKEFKDDVTIVSISDEKLPTVVKFLAGEHPEGGLWFEKIGYTLTTDPDRSNYDAYMKAAGQRGIPTAFIVGKDGHVEWIGHPMRMDDPLADVVNDEWDRAAFKAEWQKAHENEMKQARVQQKLMKAYQDEDWDKLFAMIEDLVNEDPEAYGHLRTTEFDLLLTKVKDEAKAVDCSHKIVKTEWDDAQQLNAFAWQLVDHYKTENAELLDVAMSAAMRASELTDHKDAAILDTVARVYFEQGDMMSALTWQGKAVRNADGAMKKDLEATLERYAKAAKG
jgi:thiol-disulfide isomerase/thioredoxin